MVLLDVRVLVRVRVRVGMHVGDRGADGVVLVVEGMEGWMLAGGGW